MNRIHSLCLLLVFVLGTAYAQGQDELLQRYILALENLNTSVATLASDPSASRTGLDVASGALRPLAQATTSNSLIVGLENTFERARGAIDNGSETDLAVQVAVIRGGYQRLVYESALREANAGNIALAQTRLQRLAQDMALPPETQAELGARTEPNVLQLTFEGGVAQGIQGRIGTVREQATQNVGLAYRSLAEAYSTFIAIQDSPRIGDAAAASFNNAIAALVTQNPEALNTQLDTLGTQMNEVAQTAAAAIGAAPPPAPPAPVEPAAVAPAPVEPAPVTPAPVEPAPVVVAPITPEAAPVPVAPVGSQPAGFDPTVVLDPATPAAAAPAPVEPAPILAAPVEPAPILAAPVEPAPVVPAPVEPAPVEPAPIEVAPILADAPPAAPVSPAAPAASTGALERELGGYPIGAAAARSLANLYATSGYNSVGEVLDALYVQAARSVVSVEGGNQPAAVTFIDTFGDTYRRHLEPLVNAQNPGFNSTTLRLVNNLRNAPALRVQDTVVLVSHVDAIGAVLAGRAPSGLHSAIVGTSLFWVGFVRLIVMILLMIAAFVPLRLLYLAFGGGNRNWQWVGVSLFLLLLPVIYEGLAFVSSLVAGLSGVNALNGLSTFSIFQNTIAQVVWALVTAVAIAFAIVGLYGICVQFGLLGKRTSPTTAAEAPVRLTKTETSTDTVIDWDEEF